MKKVATVLERLKIELNYKEYYSDEDFEIFLRENGLEGSDFYDKSRMQRQLLMSVLDVFEALCNDLDLYRRVVTEFATTSDAYASLQKRIYDLERRINSIVDPTEKISVFTQMYHS